MEYKVGDIVVVTERYSNNNAQKGIIGTIVKIDSDAPKFCILNRAKGVYRSYCQAVRKATIEEVEQYVKDNKCSIEEILEICKNLYPVNSKVIPLNLRHMSENTTYQTILDILDVCYKAEIWTRTEHYNTLLYKDGKFARLVKKQEELPFKVGDKFTHKSDITLVYTITDINEDYIHVTWPSDLKGYNINKHAAIEHFKNGNYLPVESKSQLKKEDFYNTKIDVSESKELNRLVQEKLFELGFKWAGGQKYYLQYTDKYLRICNDNSIIASNSSSYKEIYPQDLGININNKKQTNNVNNKETISKGISKVQGFNQQISEPSRTRGIGLERTRSKISLGVINSPNKVGLG